MSSTHKNRTGRKKENIVRSTYGWLKDPELVLKSGLKKYGLSFYLKLPLLGKTFVTGDPTIIDEIRNNSQLVGGRGMKVLRPILGDDNLIMLEGEEHKLRRNAFRKLFSSSRLRQFDDLMRLNFEQISLIYDKKDKSNVYNLAQDILLTSIVAFLFPDSLVSERKKLEIIVSDFFNKINKPHVLFFKYSRINLGRFSSWGKIKISQNTLRSEIKSMIKGALYEDLIVAGLSQEQITDELVALLLFGHDTSASALAWVVHHCLDNPEHIPKLIKDEEYLKATILESMRLNPVVVHLTRVATVDLELGDFNIDKGMRVLPSANLAHFNPLIYPNPNQFDPNRFYKKALKDNVYFPFGFGSRICIGKHFAMQQIKVLLPLIFTRLEIKKIKLAKTKSIRDNVIMVPKGEVKIGIQIL